MTKCPHCKRRIKKNTHVYYMGTPYHYECRTAIINRERRGGKKVLEIRRGFYYFARKPAGFMQPPSRIKRRVS